MHVSQEIRFLIFFLFIEGRNTFQTMFVSWLTVKTEILNLLKPGLIFLKYKEKTQKKFLAWYLRMFKSYPNLKISKFWFFSLKGNFHDFLTQKFELFCITHCMGKSSQICCRMSMNFCECVANIGLRVRIKITNKINQKNYFRLCHIFLYFFELTFYFFLFFCLYYPIGTTKIWIDR